MIANILIYIGRKRLFSMALYGAVLLFVLAFVHYKSTGDALRVIEAAPTTYAHATALTASAALPDVCLLYRSGKRRLPDADTLDHTDIGAMGNAMKIYLHDMAQLRKRAVGAVGSPLSSVHSMVTAACETSDGGTEHNGEGDWMARLSDDLLRNQHHIFHWIPQTQNKSLISLYQSYRGRGIVMTFGNRNIAYAMSSIRIILEEHHSNLPIEIYYYGPGDLSVSKREILRTFVAGGMVRVIDLKPLVGKAEMSGWALKPLALIMSSFREAILIDADTTFYKDPAVIFQESGYVKNGAFLMRDRAVGKPGDKRKEWLQTFLPNVPDDFYKHHPFMQYTHATDSSCVVVDKMRHFDALVVVTQLNMKAERGVIYKHVHGDKETFWMGFELVGDRDYAFEPIVPSQSGVFYDARDMRTLGNAKITEWPRLDADKVLAGVDAQLTSNARLCSSNFVHFLENGDTLYANGGPVFSKFEKKKWYDLRTHIAVPPVKRYFIKSGNRVCIAADTYRELTTPELNITRNAFLFYKEGMESMGDGSTVNMQGFPQDRVVHERDPVY